MNTHPELNSHEIVEHEIPLILVPATFPPFKSNDYYWFLLISFKPHRKYSDLLENHADSEQTWTNFEKTQKTIRFVKNLESIYE